MGFFNRLLKHALLTGQYFCNECGEFMEFEDEREDILVCPHCGNSVELEQYGFENPEDYESLYLTKEEFEAQEEDDNE